MILPLIPNSKPEWIIPSRATQWIPAYTDINANIAKVYWSEDGNNKTLDNFQFQMPRNPFAILQPPTVRGTNYGSNEINMADFMGTPSPPPFTSTRFRLKEIEAAHASPEISHPSYGCQEVDMVDLMGSPHGTPPCITKAGYLATNYAVINPVSKTDVVPWAYDNSSYSPCTANSASSSSSSWSDSSDLPENLLHIDIRRMCVGEIRLDRCPDGLVILGKGMYGTAMRGKLVQTGEPVVVKRISRALTPEADVYNEARITHHLQDTGVVPRVHGVTQYSKASLCLVQEFCKGKTLFELIFRQFKHHTTYGWLKICYQMTLGLLEIHEHEVLHNDIKADNIIVDFKDGEVKVNYIDFGKASYMSNEAFAFQPDDFHRFPFLAPEVRNCELNSEASDIYSLGYIFQQIQIKGIPSLSRVTKMCMQTNPNDRPGLVVVAMEIEDLLAQYEMK